MLLSRFPDKEGEELSGDGGGRQKRRRKEEDDKGACPSVHCQGFKQRQVLPTLNDSLNLREILHIALLSSSSSLLPQPVLFTGPYIYLALGCSKDNKPDLFSGVASGSLGHIKAGNGKTLLWPRVLCRLKIKSLVLTLVWG